MLDDIVYVPLYHVRWAWAMRDELDLPIDPDLAPAFRYAHMRPAVPGEAAAGAPAAADPNAKPGTTH